MKFFLSKKMFVSKCVLLCTTLSVVFLLASCSEKLIEIDGPKYMKKPVIQLNVGNIKIQKPAKNQSAKELKTLIGMPLHIYVEQWIKDKIKPIGYEQIALFKILQAQIVEMPENHYKGVIKLNIEFKNSQENMKEIKIVVHSARIVSANYTYKDRLQMIRELIYELIESVHENVVYEISGKSAKKQDIYFG